MPGVIIYVHIDVKPGFEQQFINASIENAKNSVNEEGIVRFDLQQDNDDKTKFVLVEVYRDEGAQMKHRETAHYMKWRDTVADWMSTPRTSKKVSAVFPNYDSYEYPQ
eukprot:CFRG1270T1